MNNNFKVGDKVHFIPYEGCPKHLYENGIVKTPNWKEEGKILVCFKWGVDPDKFMDYAAAVTQLNKLHKGWIQPISMIDVDPIYSDIMSFMSNSGREYLKFGEIRTSLKYNSRDLQAAFRFLEGNKYICFTETNRLHCRKDRLYYLNTNRDA